MAALDLHYGVDAAVWSGVDSLDSFDSEMQLWEEQLQEVQRKIEELYKVIEARRGANEITPNSNAQLDITLIPVLNASGYPDNGYHGRDVNSVPVQQEAFKQPSNYSKESRGYGGNYQKYGFQGYSPSSGPDVMLDILDGYLGMDSRGYSQSPERPHGPSDSRSIHSQSGSDQWTVSSRIGCVSQGEFEEAQNRKNKSSVWDEPRFKNVSWNDQFSSPERSVNKPPIKQRESVHVPTRPAHFSDSPRCPLVDRRCSSPSVLRKFGAMLAENEGKILTEDGVVTTLVPVLLPKSPKIGAIRGSKHIPFRDAQVPVTPQIWECRGAKVGVKTSHWGTDNQSDCHQGTTPSPRNTPSPHQVGRDSSPTVSRRSFSRPARPANQRPPSRWASHGPTDTPTTSVVPRSRSLSPVCRGRQRVPNYSVYTETVIM